jgi:mono/diheme cytochrome c family protein
MASLQRKLAIVLGTAAWLGAAAAAWSQTEPATDAVANGKRAYLAAGCFACHGRVGQGGAYNYPAPPLAQTRLPPDAFKVFVRTGPNEMPAYPESVLSDQDLADIHTFLRSLPGARPVKDIPLLDR